MKAQLKNYLSLTKREWNGMVVLIFLILLILGAPYIYPYFHKDNTININQFNADLTLLKQSGYDTAMAAKNVPHRGLFKFNPNGLPAVKWKLLGMSDKQIDVIKHYEAKGGRFYKPEDVKKIYGITEADYIRLEPYINIPATSTMINKVVELNSADSARLTDIQGIGPAFARQIIYYRERLGGFINKEQLKEVYGLDEIKYREIKDQVKVDASLIHRIPINTITFDKLRLLPYLDYKQVNAIIEYRAQHGKYHSIDDLAEIAIIDEGILRKIAPYLSFK
ncbi:helix-hairpin-helix domain-containing protein [Mucilaginibacter segetis]|uniref:Helix-hairpin-helix domain-containing protein n=1 Tax=Mucilaginibacter segetis TaxID=2793071 RepID=A0A934PSZ0_9SPHI|nr:helix-hairpin-helix domain-containing protein [Mucilaginibacter segetis]MBK0378403.1 helix-hairpin-helix domain-containing protein [Mucilaginibacter segetis]